MSDTQNIKHLLSSVSVISKKYDEFAKLTGENFNIFSVMRMESNEVKTHSAFIGELLNPKGSHGLEETPLELFIELLKNKFDSKKIEEDDSIKKESKFILETKTSLAIVEKYIGNRNEDCTEGGRIDIIVQDNKGKALIIENKIYAIEQTNQLTRYNNHLKDAPILFLTLEGTPPNSAGGLVEGKHYFNISYKEDIVEWLEKCLKEAVEFPMLREVIKQYIYLIKKLTKQTTNNKMSEEIKQLIAEHFKEAGILVGNYNQLINDLKQKLIKIREFLEEQLLDIKIVYIGPVGSGGDSDSFSCKFIVNGVELVYGIEIDDCDFGTGCYENQFTTKLKEHKIDWLIHKGDKEPKEIASEITDEIIKIIKILKEEVLVA
jgi:hypothetical protein